MSIVGRSSQLLRLIAWGLALCLPVAGIAAVMWWTILGETQRQAGQEVTMSLPARSLDPGEALATPFTPDPNAPPVEGAPANPAFIEPALETLKPNEPDLDLVDASQFGPLPRIADDGRRPIQTYARPHVQSDDAPKVAILVTGLGLQADATNASFHLPGAISLMFSPYTEDLPAYFERARLAGHEVVLELPMEPPDYPASDPGPHTLRASGTVDANIERLNWVLARAPGYFAVAGLGGAFAGSPEATPVVNALASKGLGLIEIDGDGLTDASRTAGLAYMSAPTWIDATPSAPAIDEALEKLEAEARENGSAIGIAEAYPVTLKRLVDWAASLKDRGITLAPVSAVLLDKAEPADDDQASNLAQSRIDEKPAHDGPPARYRPCAGIVLVNRDGLIFIGERRGQAGNAWQMPQGGIDPGEDPLTAARRELLEETGVDRTETLAESARWHCYEVPAERRPRYWRGRFIGQCQRWFAFRFIGDDDDIDLEAHEPEFSLWRWATPEEVLDLAVPFKRGVYQAVINEFRPFLIKA